MLHHRSKVTKFVFAVALIAGVLFIPSISFYTSRATADSQSRTIRVSLKYEVAKAAGPQYAITQVLTGQQEKVTWFNYLYGFSKNLLNILLFSFLVYIAFMNILNKDINTYAIKAMLPKLIGVAVVANLAVPIFAILSGMIDNIQENVNLFKPGVIDYLYILQGSGIWREASVFTAITIIGAVMAGGLSGLGCIFGGIIILAGLIIVILLNLILAFRPYIVLLSIAISPLAMGCYILPQAKFLFDKWIKIVIPWLTMPLVVFFLYNLGKIMPTSFSITGDGFISSLLGTFLPALVRAGILLLAIRFPFTVEKDISGAINTIGQQSWARIGSGIGSVATWKEQAGWRKAWSEAKNKNGEIDLRAGLMRRTARLARGIGGFVANTGTTLGQIPGVGKYLVNTPSILLLANAGELVRKQKEQSGKAIKDAMIEDADTSPYIENLAVRHGEMSVGFAQKFEDRSAEDLSKELSEFTDKSLSKTMARLTWVESSLLKKMFKRAMLTRQWEEAYGQAKTNLGSNATDKEVGEETARIIDGERAAGGGKTAIEREIETVEGEKDPDAAKRRIGNTIMSSNANQRAMFSMILDEAASNTSKGTVSRMLNALNFLGEGIADLEDNISKQRTLMRKSAKQYEAIRGESLIGKSQAELTARRNARRYSGGYEIDDEEDGKGQDKDSSRKGVANQDNAPEQRLRILPSDEQPDISVINANQDISSLMENIRASRETNLSVETIRRMARTMKKNDDFGSDGAGSAEVAVAISSRLEKVMSPERFAMFSRAVAGNDEVTVNQILQSANGEERALIQAEISAKEIAAAHALQSGEAQNVAVYATKIAPQFAMVKDKPQVITQLKESAAAIVTNESNMVFNSTNNTTARQTLSPDELNTHKTNLARVMGIAPDTVDGQSAQFFIQAIDALESAVSKPAADNQSNLPGTTPPEQRPPQTGTQTTPQNLENNQ